MFQMFNRYPAKLMVVSNTSQNFTNLSDYITTQKMKFFIKDFFSKCDQIHCVLWIWSYLLKKFLMEIFIDCAVYISKRYNWNAIIFLLTSIVFFIKTYLRQKLQHHILNNQITSSWQVRVGAFTIFLSVHKERQVCPSYGSVSANGAQGLLSVQCNKIYLLAH